MPDSLGQSKSWSRAPLSGSPPQSISIASPTLTSPSRAHKEVLYFASPFFEAALSGHWSETGRPLSMSSVITISQPPVVPGDKPDLETEMTFAPMDPSTDQVELDELSDSDGVRLSESDAEGGTLSKCQARDDSLAKLQGSGSIRRKLQDTSSSARKLSASHAKVRRRPKDSPDAVIVLKEEKVSWVFAHLCIFVLSHSVRPIPSMTSSNLYTPSALILFFQSLNGIRSLIRLSLECTITWNNVESLMNISHKLCVTSLQQECLQFLITHAAGRPIKAMRIAELFEEEELYREASRFVLDNPGGWSEHDLSTLSKETLLKLEKRHVFS